MKICRNCEMFRKKSKSLYMWIEWSRIAFHIYFNMMILKKLTQSIILTDSVI